MTEAEAFGHEAPCADCGKVATSIELFPPGVTPEAWRKRDESLLVARRGDDWWYLFRGVVGYNGSGDPVEATEALGYIESLTSGRPQALAELGFYDDLGLCCACEEVYCYTHWNVSGGAGRCPEGHFKSLDPHWHPGMDD